MKKVRKRRLVDPMMTGGRRAENLHPKTRTIIPPKKRVAKSEQHPTDELIFAMNP